MAFKPGIFLQKRLMPRKIQHWTLCTLLERLMNIGAGGIRHAGKITFRMAKPTIPVKLSSIIPEM
jgi:hypothetical protein